MAVEVKKTLQTLEHMAVYKMNFIISLNHTQKRVNLNYNNSSNNNSSSNNKSI